MQIKTTMRYHFTPVRMAITKGEEKASVGEDVEKREPLCTVGGNADWCSHCGKQYEVSSNKLKMEVSFDPTIALLGLYLNNPEIPIQKNLCTPMFIAPQFTIAKCWKQPK